MGKGNQLSVIVGSVQKSRHKVVQIKVFRIHIFLQIHQLAGIREYSQTSDLHLGHNRSFPGRQRRLHLCAGLRVGALLNCLYVNLVLGLIEGFRKLLDQLSVGRAHAVPELNLNFLIGGLRSVRRSRGFPRTGATARQRQDCHTCKQHR